MQILLKDISIDHYPYHGINFNVKHWHKYNHTFKQREDWSKNLIADFITKLEKILKKVDITNLNKVKLRNINLLESCTILTIKDFLIYKVTTNVTNQALNTSVKKKRSASFNKNNIETNTENMNDIFRTNQFFIKQQIYNKRPFLSSNYEDFNLPNDTLFGQFFFSEFYFPEDINYPIPSPQIFVQISPILVNIDFLTLLWLNALSLSLWHEKLIVDRKQTLTLKIQKESIHCDTYLEVIMPKATVSIYPYDTENNLMEKRPNGIEIGFAKICVSNLNYTEPLMFDNFKNTYEQASSSSASLCQLHSHISSRSIKTDIFSKNNKNRNLRMNNLAPCYKEIANNANISFIRCDLSGDSDISKFINIQDTAELSITGLFLRSLNKNAFNKTSKKDLWSIDCDSMWIDMFEGESIKSSNLENSTILQNCSFKLWFINVWEFYNSLNINKASTSKILKHDYESDDYSECFELKKTYYQENLGNNQMAYNDVVEKLKNVIEIEKKIKLTKKRSNSLSITSSESKHNQESNNLYHQIYSKLNIISHLKEIRIVMNHSNIVFLLRLMNVIELFADQIKLDSEKLLKHKSNEKPKFDNLIEPSDLSDALSANLSLIVDLIDIELIINDYHKENTYIMNRFESQNTDKNSFEQKISQVTNDSELIKDDKDEKSSMSLSVSDSIKDQVTKEFENSSSMQLNQDFIADYLKFIYGLNNENQFVFRQGLNNNKNNDALSFSEKNSKITSASPSNINESSTTKNIHSLTNNPSQTNNKIKSFSLLKSNITSKNMASDQLLDLLNDNDSVTDLHLQAFEHEDTISVLSFSSDVISNQNALESTKYHINELQLSSNANIQNVFCNLLGSDSSSSFVSYNQKQSSNQITDSINNTGSFENEIKEKKDKQIQTIKLTRNIKIQFFKLESYFQVYDSDISMILVLDQIQLENKKSHFFDQNGQKTCKNEKKSNTEIVVLFKKLLNDAESKNGMAKIILRNFSIQADIETINGLAELVEDDEYYDKTKASVPINLFIENSNFHLIYHENENKNISVKINKIILNKLANNEIEVSEINMPFGLENNFFLEDNNLLKKKDFHNSIENNYLINTLNDRSIKIAKERSKFKNLNASQFASLVYMLRDSKSENRRLQKVLIIEKEKIRLEQIKNDKLLSELNELKDAYRMEKETDKIKNDNVDGKDNLNFENELRKFEFERKQFESLLKKAEDENEILKQKLKKSEERTIILNIENTNLIKKLNQ